MVNSLNFLKYVLLACVHHRQLSTTVGLLVKMMVQILNQVKH